MDWVSLNTVLLACILVLLLDARVNPRITVEQILLYLGLNVEEVRGILKEDKEEVLRKLSELRVKIPDQVLKDFRNEKKRNKDDEKT